MCGSRFSGEAEQDAQWNDLIAISTSSIKLYFHLFLPYLSTYYPIILYRLESRISLFDNTKQQCINQIKSKKIRLTANWNMDIFQLIGDLLHLLALLVLLFKILDNRNVTGISYKTQQIYAVVFVSRYIDIFLGWKALYLFIMKFVFTGVTAYICYLFLLRKPFCLSYNKQMDSFPHYFLYGVAAILTMIIHKSFLPIQLLWSYSQWLQAFAILPQLLIVHKLRNVQNITANFVFLMGLYRMFYILHWFYSWNNVIWTSFLAGVLQSLLYADFIYYFIKSDRNEKIMSIPI